MAAVAAASAHLAVACEGGPVVLPDGPVAELFGRSVAALFPSGPPAKFTGGPWRPPGGTAGHGGLGTAGLPRGDLAASGTLPLRPVYTFRPDRRVFLHTPARLPAVRRPRGVYDRVWESWIAAVFF